MRYHRLGRQANTTYELLTPDTARMTPLYCSQKHENPAGSRFCLKCGEKLDLPVSKGIYPGLLLERYRIVRQLSAGGFGRAYLAEDMNRFNEQCVLKEFAPQVQGDLELQKAKELFEREAGALYKLDHPQLPKFREFFQATLEGGVGCLFLAQDYVEGQTYYDVLKSCGRLSESEVKRFLCQLLPVLSYLHSQGVIHRDISPDNIIKRRSDQMPVLIDFGGVKQVSKNAVFKLTKFGGLPTRLGKKGYAPEEQLQQGKVFHSSDLYALAVTALVLLTRKEPQELYDSYKGTWHWLHEIRISSQLEAVLQKMLAYKPNNRYQSAAEVIQALQSPTTPPPPAANISQMRTVNFVGQKPVPDANYSQHKGGTQIMPTSSPNLSWLRPWAVRVAGAGVVVLTGIGAWGLVNSIPSKPLAQRSPSTLLSSSETRTKTLFSRRQALAVKQTFFNALVDDSFYMKHPELRRRSLENQPNDAKLRQEWYQIAQELLDKLEQAELSKVARSQLGSYSQSDYDAWKGKVNRGRISKYKIEQLKKQTDDQFYQLFPQQRDEKLNQKTFGQIWYAIFSDKVSQLEIRK